jgi:hypothetical protein
VLLVYGKASKTKTAMHTLVELAHVAQLCVWVLWHCRSKKKYHLEFSPTLCYERSVPGTAPGCRSL